MKAREYMHLKWFKEGKQVRQMKTLTGAEIVIECLKEQGVDTVFGYPGGAILNIYDALYKHKDEITHILTSHEQGASHAADGYARATGKVGVCMATSGPGATNLVRRSFLCGQSVGRERKLLVWEFCTFLNRRFTFSLELS